jgi:hypothetical protein
VSFFIGALLGNLVNGYIYRKLWQIVKEGSGIGAYLSVGAPLWYPAEGGYLLGIRAQGTGISFCRGPVGELGRVLIYRRLM